MKQTDAEREQERQKLREVATRLPSSVLKEVAEKLAEARK